MIMVADKYGQVGDISKRYDLCPDCIQALTDFMKAIQEGDESNEKAN